MFRKRYTNGLVAAEGWAVVGKLCVLLQSDAGECLWGFQNKRNVDPDDGISNMPLGRHCSVDSRFARRSSRDDAVAVQWPLIVGKIPSLSMVMVVVRRRWLSDCFVHIVGPRPSRRGVRHIVQLAGRDS